MRILVIPLGSAGDVHPYVGVALALRRRGHDVSVITSPYFAPLLERVGLPHAPLGTVDDLYAILDDPRLWHPRHGLRVIGEAIRKGTADLYRLIAERAGAGDLVLVAPGMAFGARIAHEVLGLPLVTMHLQPSCFMSLHDTPVFHRRLASINRWPRVFKRPMLALGEWMSDRALAPGASALCAELGLAPARRIVSTWWHSPQRVVGLFPDWYAALQPDWPPQTTLTGFPLYDEAGATAVTAEVDRFLAEAEADGDPPLIFVPGSANRQATRFFGAAIDACRRLGRRGLLLTRFAGQIPAPLPAGVQHADYAPLSLVLPRAAALIHHGGIGTAAQALRAGRPHLVMPMTFDQPDNAARLERLGVGRTVYPDAFTGTRLAAELETLLGSDDIAAACRAVATRLEHADPITRTCEVIETTGTG